jgi:hypothetical protein
MKIKNFKILCAQIETDTMPESIYGAVRLLYFSFNCNASSIDDLFGRLLLWQSSNCEKV